MEDDAVVQQEAGLQLIHLWRSLDYLGNVSSPGQVFLVMEAQDMEKARSYFTGVALTWAKKRAGVHQYEWHFAEEVALPVA